MGITVESNFPNSRITAQLQGNDVDHPGNLITIDGQQVVVGPTNYKALLVQIAQSSGSRLLTNANLNQYQGLSNFNISNPFVPEAYNKVVFSYTATTDRAAFYSVVGAISTFIRTIVTEYTDASKNIVSQVYTDTSP